MYDSFRKNMTIFINVSDPHIRVISEGSCDTEDWSNDDKFRNKLHFTAYSHRNQLIYINISLFLLYFSSNKCNNHKRLNNQTSLDPRRLNGSVWPLINKLYLFISHVINCIMYRMTHLILHDPVRYMCPKHTKPSSETGERQNSDGWISLTHSDPVSITMDITCQPPFFNFWSISQWTNME